MTNHARAIEPPLWIVEAIFGRSHFPEPLGLHFATSYQGDLVSGLGIGPLSHPVSEEILGGDISFEGFRFVIWLSCEELVSFSIPPPRSVIVNKEESDLKYRLELMQFPIRNVVNQKLLYDWTAHDFIVKHRS